MNGDEPQLVYYGLWLVLLIASLGARRLPIKDTLKMALAWVAIFGTLFVLFTFRGDFVRIWQHVKEDVAGTTSSADGIVRLKMGEDGHFHANVQLNAISVRMLVDTGASSTTVSYASARKAGIAIGEAKFPVLVDTANGTVTMERAEVAHFAVGAIKRDGFAVLVNQQDDLDVLGMNFLSTLKSWRVEGDELILAP